MTSIHPNVRIIGGTNDYKANKIRVKVDLIMPFIHYLTDPLALSGYSLRQYTLDLWRLFEKQSDVVEILSQKKDLPVLNLNLLKSNSLPYPVSLVNRLFPQLAFANRATYLKKPNSIIHLTSQFTDPIISGGQVTVTVHDLLAFNEISKGSYTFAISQLLRRNIRKYIKENYDILTVSNHVRDELISKFGLNPQKISVIPPMVSQHFFKINDQRKLRLELNLPLEEKLILSVSSSEVRKNLSMVQSIAKKLPEGVRLVRVGERIGKSITFHDVDPILLNKIYNSCDMLYFPTLEEGFGYPIVEAFKTGLPVVASDIDVIKEVTKGSSVLVDPHNIDENYQAILQVLSMPESFTNEGNKVADKYYSEEIIKKKMDSYYNNLTIKGE